MPSAKGADSSGHCCRARNCTQMVPHAKLMCLRHWLMVPRQIQRRVNAAWRDLLTGEPDARATYLDAVKQAVQSIPA